MGCGSSKGDVIRSASDAAREADKVVKTTVKPAATNGVNGGGKNGAANGVSANTTVSPVAVSGASTIPASDLYRNGSSLGRPLGHLPPLKPPRVGKSGSQDELEPNQNKPNVPIAFEVPADDPGGGGGGDSSLIKRHPPRRLRKLVELQPDESTSSLTHATIEEKVQQANQRRNQVLTQRVASARQKSARIRRPFMDPGGLTLNEFDGEIETGDKDESNAPDGLQ